MNLRLSCLSFAVALTAVSLPAATWYVDNQPGHVSDFTTLAAAIAAAADGDTIHFAGSPVSYGGGTISKRLHLVGPGSFLGSNFDALPQSRPAVVADLLLVAGAEGSTITGLHVNGTVYLRTSNLTLRRSRCGHVYMDLAGALTGLFVLQNWIDSAIISNTNGNMVDALIEGNRFNYIAMDTGDSAVIRHNVILSQSSTFHFSHVHSNIFLTSVAVVGNFTNCSVQYNVAANGSGTPAMAGGNNRTEVALPGLFAPGRGEDQIYLLAEGSPARQAGLDGRDVGMFGGLHPYVAGGVPPGPRIIRLDTPSAASATSGLTVRVQAIAQP